MKKVWILVSVMIVALLGACGTSISQDEEQAITTSTNGSGDSNAGKNDDVTETEKNDETTEVSEETNQSPLPAEKEIEVLVEGSKELRHATLTKSSLGYSLYVLDDYTFDQEEPGKDVVTMNYDSSFFARIEVLDKAVNYDELKERLLTALKDMNIVEEKPAAHYLESFHDAKFYLIGKENSTTVLYVAKEVKGKGFLYTIHLPQKEAAEGAGPSLWAILSTVTPE
ncbi:hypothetical protein [Bacillus pinisoli]|uniref:hypothetical protein n=1 Tax=Bacillus pinisoli TaxID=2901866 RepID=UPI001FF4818A|nr:hypothetical protein [Bacillus pinisoli]